MMHPSRGEYLSTGMLEIVNQSNGSIYICVDTFAHVNVDREFASTPFSFWINGMIEDSGLGSS